MHPIRKWQRCSNEFHRNRLEKHNTIIIKTIMFKWWFASTFYFVHAVQRVIDINNMSPSVIFISTRIPFYPSQHWWINCYSCLLVIVKSYIFVQLVTVFSLIVWVLDAFRVYSNNFSRTFSALGVKQIVNFLSESSTLFLNLKFFFF